MINGRFFRFCIVVLLAAAALSADTITFSGRVVDSETETGLAGVSISLPDSVVKSITDQNGQFSFSVYIPVAAANAERLQRSLPILRRNARMLDLKSAPQVSSVGIYNLKGERLFFKERLPESDVLPMPGLPKNVYMVRIATRGGKFFDVKWVHMGNSFSFTLGTFGDKTGSLSKQTRIIDSLVFEKQGYQTNRTGIDSDSSYLSMNVKMKPEIGYGIFNDDTIRTYRIRLAADDMAMLLDYSKLITGQTTVNTVYVPARLEFQGRTMDSIGVRFRGNQSLWDCISNGMRKKNLRYPQYGFGNGDICAKFSMKFDFNQYKKGCRLYGLKALNFRSMSADPTKMHEKLAFSIFNDMGIASPRSAYARLYVNDTLWGLFGITEQIDDRFTKVHYPKASDGNLYKEIWPDAGAIDASILEAMKTNNDPEDTTDISDFKTLRDVVTAPATDSNNFLQKVNLLVDIPYLVRYIVVDRGIMNFDGIMSNYGGSMRQNCYWYHDDESGLFQLIPWDLEKVFIYPEPNYWTNNSPNGKNIVPNWNVVNSSYANIRCYYDQGDGNTYGYTVSPIDKDKFLRLLRGATWSDFHTQGQAFLDSVFTQERLDARMKRWRALIANAVGEDPTIDSTEWAVMVDSLSHTIPLMRTNLKMMIDTLIRR